MDALSAELDRVAGTMTPAVVLPAPASAPTPGAATPSVAPGRSDVNK
jgi:hypothetical protein